MTTGEIVREIVGAVIASHYNPRWTIVTCRWIIIHMAEFVVAVKSKL